MVREILALAFATAFAYAQPKFELRGTVTDPNTNQPLQDVEISIIAGNGAIYPDTKIERATTDSQGTFRFVPPAVGQYILSARKDGYARVSRIENSTQGSAFLTAEKPSASFTFFLEQTAGVSGVIIDDETEKPIANLKVGVNTYRSVDGRVSARGAWVTTNGDGRFQYAAPAGNYLIEIQPYMSRGNRVLTKFTEEDIRATDLDYRSQFFPGGAGADSGLSFSVTSGSSASVGTIRIRKQPLFRVYVNLDKSSCPDGAEMSGADTILRFRSSEGRDFPSIPCGPFLLTHMNPGEYELSLSAGKDDAKVETSLRYTVTEQNLELPLRLSHGNTLRGTIKRGDGVDESLLTTLKVSFAPIASSVPMADVQPHDVDAKGRFEFVNVHPKRRKVQVTGLGTEYFIQEVRYRGAAQPGSIFYYTGDGELEIEIGRSPASITGSVMNQDKPLPNADVVFMRWPNEPDDDRDAVRHIAADADGKFQIAGIVPGDYRLFAVAAKDRSQAEQPAPWQRLVSRAEKLALARGASQNLVIQVSDPSR